MTILSKLTPAETLLLSDGYFTNYPNLLKYTLMDLLIKRVLKIDKRQFQARANDKIREVIYITQGEKFLGYESLPHEFVFLKIYNTEPVSILFRHLVKVGYENAHSEYAYKKMIAAYKPLDECFEQNFFQRIFLKEFSLTDKGEELQIKIKAEIDSLNNTLPGLIANDKDQAAKIIHAIGGNIFLLKNIDFKLVHDLDKDFMDEMNKRKSSAGCSTGCGTGCSVLTDFDTHSHSFDNSCSSAHDSGCGSSCGGDSGCSGCGGCGGD
jgi:hypothetical protein